MLPPKDKGNSNSMVASITLAYETRLKIIKDIVKDTYALLKHFKERREKMANELRETLAQYKSLRKKDFNRLMTSILETQNKREEEVKRMLEAFHGGEEMIVEKLRKFLEKKGGSARDVKKMLHDIRHMQEKNAQEYKEPIDGKMEEMQKEVHVMLLNFKQERESIAGAWEEAINLLSEKKARSPIKD